MNISDLAAKIFAYPDRMFQSWSGPSGYLIDALYLLPVPAAAALWYINSEGYLYKRARKGSLDALLRLTRPFIRKDPVSQREAAQLMHSARNGVAWAMHEISGRMAEGGETCFLPDRGLGHLWLMLAAQNGHPESIQQMKGQRGIDPERGRPSSSAAAPPAPTRSSPAPGYGVAAMPQADPLKELDGLIGLEGIKKAVSDIADRAQLFRLRRKKGLVNSQPALHLVFMGNPGTGKTVVARIIGGVLRQTGYLARGHVVEVAAPEMISQWVGETPQKVKENVMKALDGVLFIDEAYALLGYGTSGGGNLGTQAVATLLKLMEDYKDRLVVVAAGYPAEMQGFLDANPGFRSRFTDVITFEDYSAEELVTIFDKMARDQQFKVDAAAARALVETMREAKVIFARNFSNGRFVRNLFEHAVKNLAARIGHAGQHSRQDIEVLKADDIRKALEDLRKTNAPGAKPVMGAETPSVPLAQAVMPPFLPPENKLPAQVETKIPAQPETILPAQPVFQKSSLPSPEKVIAPVSVPAPPDPPRVDLMGIDPTAQKGAPATAPQALIKALESKVDPFSELDGFVGLAAAKKAISDISDGARHFDQRRLQGLPAQRPVIHMVLQGNPGTGKTSVARLMGRILKRTGYLSGGQVVELQLSDLIGSDAGATARKVRDEVLAALDGVLLIDGAYMPGGDDGAAREMVSLLLKLMEDYKDRFVVILTGYPKEIDRLLNADPGFRSRFPEVITFEDYPPGDLADIYRKFAKDQQYRLEPAAETLLASLLGKPGDRLAGLFSAGHFSNGRFIRNLFEDSIKKLAARTDKQPVVTREDMETIRAADLELAFAEALKQEDPAG